MGPEFLAAISAALSAAAAIFAASVAFLSYKVSRDQFRFGLFEQRFKVYQDVANVIVEASKDGMLDDHDVYTLSKIKQRSQFLFGEDINGYIDEVKKHAAVSGRIAAELEDRSIDSEKRSEFIGKMISENEYRGLQFDGLYKRFRRYLNFSLK